MSVLIKGMEMPKNCGECPCYYETEGCWRDECQVLHKEYKASECRPSWCPLIEIPPLWQRMSAYAEAFGKNISEEDYRKFETALCETVCREDADG